MQPPVELVSPTHPVLLPWTPLLPQLLPPPLTLPLLVLVLVLVLAPVLAVGLEYRVPPI